MNLSDLKLNKFDIVNEMENQTQIVIKYGELLSEVKSKLREQEENLKVLKSSIKSEKERRLSTIELEIKKMPYKFGVLKANPSESMIKAIAKTNEDYINFCKLRDKRFKQQIKRVCRLVEKEEKISTYVKAADQKRSMITEAIKLLIGGFFSINTQRIENDYNNIKGD